MKRLQLGFQIPAPRGLLTPKPTPTAIPTIKKIMVILMAILVLRSRRAKHWQDLLLILAARAFCFQCSCPGHTELLQFTFAVDRRLRQCDDCCDAIASISVSYGVPWWAVGGGVTLPLRLSSMLIGLFFSSRVVVDVVEGVMTVNGSVGVS